MFKKIYASTKNHLLLLILVLASLLRFINLGHPPVYIFDEVYHAFTAKEIMHGHIEAWEWWTTPPPGVAYEWTHPPVAKYGMILGMLLFGENAFGYRVCSALFGVLSILGIYHLTLTLTRRKDVALLASLLVSIEGTHIAQSRIAMNDIYMLNFYVWSLYAALKSRWKMAAILYGLALGSKWSAVYGAIPLALIYLHHPIHKFVDFKSFLLNLLYALRYTLLSVIVYTLTFTPFILAGHTWAQWWELHRQMWYYHTHLVATHAYQSTPLQWVFVTRPVWYWVEYGQGVIRNIYVQGNPLILWLGLSALIFQLPKIFKYPYFIIHASYFIFVLPWIFSPRIMFYYHYLPSAYFLCILLASWIGSLPRAFRIGALVACFFGLILISPMLYGYPLSTQSWDYLFKLFPSWR